MGLLERWKREIFGEGDDSQGSSNNSGGSNNSGTHTTADIILWDMKKYEAKNSWPSGDRRLPKLTYREYGVCSLEKGTEVNIGKLLHRYEVPGRVDEVHEASAKIDGNVKNGFIFTIYEGNSQVEGSSKSSTSSTSSTSSKNSDDKKSSNSPSKSGFYITIKEEVILWDMHKYKSKYSWPNGDQRMQKLIFSSEGIKFLPKNTIVHLGKLMHRYEVPGKKVDEVYEASAKIDDKWQNGFIFTIYGGNDQAKIYVENVKDPDKKGDNYRLNKPTGANDFQFAKKNGVEIPFSAELKESDHWTFTSSFGGRHDPFTREWKGHGGQDIGAKIGTAVNSLHDGIANVVGELYGGNYGNFVKVNEGNGKETLYAHLSRFNITDGQKVKRGDIIGYVGSTGKSTGAHLHWEKRINGMPIDPMK